MFTACEVGYGMCDVMLDVGCDAERVMSNVRSGKREAGSGERGHDAYIVS